MTIDYKPCGECGTGNNFRRKSTRRYPHINTSSHSSIAVPLSH